MLVVWILGRLGAGRIGVTSFGDLDLRRLRDLSLRGVCGDVRLNEDEPVLSRSLRFEIGTFSINSGWLEVGTLISEPGDDRRYAWYISVTAPKTACLIGICSAWKASPRWPACGSSLEIISLGIFCRSTSLKTVKCSYCSLLMVASKADMLANRLSYILLSVRTRTWNIALVIGSENGLVDVFPPILLSRG